MKTTFDFGNNRGTVEIYRTEDETSTCPVTVKLRDRKEGSSTYLELTEEDAEALIEAIKGVLAEDPT